ncbi:diguanylate cyclase [Haliea sp. E17]|uniref:sensor domain-containing diguanylate cyclase n=1 Tax=Haliea sp. E17 TaxID=3401576 RepID=UPI003AAF820C
MAILLAILVSSLLLPAAGGAHAGTAAADVLEVNASDLHGGLELRAQWHFQPGDDSGWAAPGYDDSNWQRLSLPHRWERGGYPETGQMAWYRLTLQFPLEVMASDNLRGQLAISIGKVMNAYELYAGGRRLGGVGRMPPFAQGIYDQQQFYVIPEAQISAEGRLVLALRVWGGEDAAVAAWGGGPYAGSFLVGDYRSLILRGVVGGLPGLLFCALSLAFGAHHLLLYLRNRSLRAYLWFSLLAVDMAIYGLMLSQWKYLLPFEFLTLKKTEFVSLYIFPALASQLLLTLIDRHVAWPLRVYQFGYLVAGALVILVPGAWILYASLPLWQLSVVPIFVFLPLALWREARRGNREARTILPAVALFLATCIYDLLIEVLHLEGIRLMPLGFLAMLMGMSFSLVNRFTCMFNELEQEVAQRTAELIDANMQLVEAARIDPLTGMLNRRGFTEEAEAEMSRMARSGERFSIILADVDYFKRFNDEYGHICGDNVLRRMSEILYQRTRDIDQIARWGGEEFIMLLPETDTEGAVVLAEKLRHAVENAEFDFGGERMRITMTFGVSAFRTGDTLDSCIARADTAMYHGKKNGRNRVMIGKSSSLSVVS